MTQHLESQQKNWAQCWDSGNSGAAFSLSLHAPAPSPRTLHYHITSKCVGTGLLVLCLLTDLKLS